MRGPTVVVVAVVAACVSLTPDGRMVRNLTRTPTLVQATCTFLGVVESGFKAHDQGAALNQVRNAVAELGGDAYVVLAEGSVLEPRVEAEAYDCDFPRRDNGELPTARANATGGRP